MSDEHDRPSVDLCSLVEKRVRQRLAVVVQPVRACDGPEADDVSIVAERHDASTGNVLREESAWPESTVAMRPGLLPISRESMDEDDAFIKG